MRFSTVYSVILPSSHVLLTRPQRLARFAVFCSTKVQTGKASHETLHLRDVFQATYLESRAPSAVYPCVIMDRASGSKRVVAGDEHEGGIDTEVGTTASMASMYPYQRGSSRSQQQPLKETVSISQCICCPHRMYRIYSHWQNSARVKLIPCENWVDV